MADILLLGLNLASIYVIRLCHEKMKGFDLSLLLNGHHYLSGLLQLYLNISKIINITKLIKQLTTFCKAPETRKSKCFPSEFKSSSECPGFWFSQILGWCQLTIKSNCCYISYKCSVLLMVNHNFMFLWKKKVIKIVVSYSKLYNLRVFVFHCNFK